MKIAKMAKLDGASKYGSCTECWKKLTHILDEIDFNDVLKTLKKTGE